MSDTNHQMVIACAFLFVTWVANINDLIRGEWFYFGWQSVLIINFFGIISLGIILNYAFVKNSKSSGGEQ